MTVVSISITCYVEKDGRDTHIECNLLKREDWNDREWMLAKLLEAALVGVTKEIGTNIKTEFVVPTEIKPEEER